MIRQRFLKPAILAVALAASLTGCQTMPSSPYSAAQVETLERNGFRAQDGNYMLGLHNKVLFAFDSSNLHGNTETMLFDLGRSLAAVGIRSAGIEGHASSEGDEAYNRKLSEQRANSVRAALVRGGLDSAAMRVRGMGSLDPVAPNDSEEGRLQNRRVVIIVTPADTVALR